MYFVFAADPNYIQHLTVCLHSLWHTNNHLVEKLFLILTSDPSTDTTKFIHGIEHIKSLFGDRLTVISLDSVNLGNFQASGHVSLSTFSRILIAELLPSNLDKVLYFDSDIVFNGKLDALEKLNFDDSSESYVFAVDHYFSKDELGYYSDKFGVSLSRYFNAGVLIINLNLWRQDKIHILAKNLSIQYGDAFLWWDQDILNIIFNDNWELLNESYNYFYEGIICKMKINKELKPLVIHYAGKSKPWDFMNKNRHKSIYYDYLFYTPFNNYKPKDKTIINFFYKYIFPSYFMKFIMFIKFYLKVIVTKIFN